MQIISSKPFVLLLLLALLVNACTITTEDDDLGPSDTDAQITGIDASGWIYSDLIIEGSGFEVNCGNISISISDGNTTQSLAINDCTDAAITAWIPEDTTPGTYSISVDIDGNTFTSINGTDMEVEVKNRPVVLSMSKTMMDDGETITIEGLHLLNQTTVPQNDPKVWIMGTGYTNTVSEITVNSDGTAATIVIDEGIDAGEYNFLLTTDEWSNEIVITIL